MSTPQHPYGPPPQAYGPAPVPQPYGAPAPQPYGPPQPAPAGYGAPPPPPGYGYQAAQAAPQAAPPYPHQPYPQQPHPQAPYGPPSPHGYPPAAPVPPGAPAAKGRGKARLKAAGLVLGVIALVVGYFVSGPSVSSAKAGDCVKASGSRDVSVVKCTDSKANYKVLATFDSTTDATRCRSTAGTTSTVSGKSGRRWNKKRYVLCLGPLTGVPPVKKS
ncbi:hypothetical protein ABT093_38770 [Kitasatospora sp. NPDC002551]|uniref:LppU/SCO3897 family protein n=1 Tax=unclassified Kitasatospora TaxID=2633591 RepID=UPI0033166D75